MFKARASWGNPHVPRDIYWRSPSLLAFAKVGVAVAKEIIWFNRTLNASTNVTNMPKRSFRVIKFFMKKCTSFSFYEVWRAEALEPCPTNYGCSTRASWGNPHVCLAVYYAIFRCSPRGCTCRAIGVHCCDGLLGSGGCADPLSDFSYLSGLYGGSVYEALPVSSSALLGERCGIAGLPRSFR